jgi:Flp pilus assembly protein protease CpaA
VPFPDSTFAWIFFLVLVGFAAAAAYTDLTKAIIPNKLNVTILAVGVVMNLIRGGWIGSQGNEVWVLGKGGTGIGLLDGFLFSLAGFAVAFAVLLGLWMLTQTGAGDVKLFAALGAWVGIKGFVYIWIVSLPLLMVWMALRIVFGTSSLKQEKKDAKRIPRKAGRTRTTYSLPIAVSVVLSGLWLCRVGLQIVPPNPPNSPPPATGTNGSPDGPPSPNAN